MQHLTRLPRKLWGLSIKIWSHPPQKLIEDQVHKIWPSILVTQRSSTQDLAMTLSEILSDQIPKYFLRLPWKLFSDPVSGHDEFLTSNPRLNLFG